MKVLLSLILFLCTVEVVSELVPETESQQPASKISFLKSLTVSGWSYQYVDKANWKRDDLHLSAAVSALLGQLALNRVISGTSVFSHIKAFTQYRLCYFYRYSCGIIDNFQIRFNHATL